MVKVGILSDTHGYFNPALFGFFSECDELWHAGDWGSMETVETLKKFKPVKGVHGNIDDRHIRSEFPATAQFRIEGVNVCILHIGGYPGHYSSAFRKILTSDKPDLMVCGHSHILKVMRDPEYNLMHINPGAAGIHGFQKSCTALRLSVEGSRLFDMELWEVSRNQDFNATP